MHHDQWQRDHRAADAGIARRGAAGNRRRVGWGLLFAAALAGSGAQAQAIKCVDAQGRITYSDQPCPGQKSEPLKLHNTARDEERARRLQREAATAEIIRQEDDRRIRRSMPAERSFAQRDNTADECARLREQLRDAKEWRNVWRNPGLREIEERKRRDAEQRMFSLNCESGTFLPNHGLPR